LTTVIAVRCRDGVILCADAQETNEYVGLGTKELVSKIYPVTYGDKTDEHCVLGCAGVPAYINQLREHVGEAIFKREGKSYFKALDSATGSFARYVYSRKLGYSVGQDLSTTASAIFVGYEPEKQKTYMCLLQPPNPPDPLLQRYCVTIGSGQLYASLLVSIAEALMRKMDLDWYKLSSTLVAQFCYMVLGRITSYDIYSGLGISIFRIEDQKGKWEYVTPQQMFPGHGTTEKYRLSVLLKTLKDEVPKHDLFELAKQYGFLEILADFLSEK